MVEAETIPFTISGSSEIVSFLFCYGLLCQYFKKRSYPYGHSLLHNLIVRSWVISKHPKWLKIYYKGRPYKFLRLVITYLIYFKKHKKNFFTQLYISY